MVILISLMLKESCYSVFRTRVTGIISTKATAICFICFIIRSSHHYESEAKIELDLLVGLRTVTVEWEYNLRCVLGVFGTYKLRLHELWNQLSFIMCPQVFLTYSLWEIKNPSTQSWEIAIWRMQDSTIFAWFLVK